MRVLILYYSTIPYSSMKRVPFIFLSVLVSACKLVDVPPATCRIVAVQESLQYLTSTDIILTNTLLKYDAQNNLLNVEVNSNSTNRRASYSLNISTLANKERVFEYRFADGLLTADTIKFNEKGYRTQIRKRFSGGIQTILDYTYDATGFPEKITQKDHTGKVYSEAKWVVENGNLTKFLLAKDGVFEESEVYEYDAKVANNRNYYIGQYQFATLSGKPPKTILNRIKKGTNEYTYTDYQFESHGFVSAYIENYTPSFNLPYIRKVKLTYEGCEAAK